MARLLLAYEAGCPNCGGRADEERLERGLPCRTCLPEDVSADDFEERVLLVGALLRARGALKGYWYMHAAVSRLREFEAFFRRVTGGHGLWSAQRTWAQRLLMGESLALVAPTGVGKTTLLMAYSVYRAARGDKVYYLVPTGNLVRQTLERLTRYAERAGADLRIVGYASDLPKRVREGALRAVEAGELDVLVSTTSFLARRWDLLRSARFDLVVVDDVDAVLRSSGNVERILMLLGVPERAIHVALEAVKTKMKAVVARASGRVGAYEEALRRLEALEAELSALLAEASIGQLVIASATGRARGLKPKLFRELLGFDVGRVYDSIRNVYNCYVAAPDPVEAAASVVERLVSKGATGLVFVSQLLGRAGARRLAELLARRGVRTALALSGTRVLDRFASGELDVLVGVASYYGVIVRGLDMPERVYFTVFAEVPARRMELSRALSSPLRIARLAAALSVEGHEELLRRLARVTQSELTALRIALERGEELGGRLGELLKMLVSARELLLGELLRRLRGRTAVVLEAAGAVIEREGSGAIYYVAPDAPTYVQASGRASRYLGGGMTRGISVVVTSRPQLLELLARRLRAYVEAADFEPLDEGRLEEEVEEARRTRSGVSAAAPLRVESALIVVESPTKARTIAGFFGKPVVRRVGGLVAYETTFYNPVNGRVYVATITSTRGHIYDLTVDERGVYGVEVEGGTLIPVYAPIKQCLNCGTQFASTADTCPRCASANIVSKASVVDALRKLATEVDAVYLATDPDIEGEKIAYDVYLLLRPVARRIARIELHEITRAELFRALASPRDVSRPLVRAQVVRRVEDRWIGFGLSRILWGRFGKRWLGAGRVQTPVLGWIVRRYEEWRRSRGYVVSIAAEGGLRLRLVVPTREEAEELAAGVVRTGLRVVSVAVQPVKLPPPPPFTTETLIYEASARLGYTSEKTMRLAQDLFENGLITYHRTESTHVSAAGVALAREYLEARGMAGELQPRSWGEPGHHEAIRPTRPVDAESLRRLVALGEVKLSSPLRESHYRLYDLIFRRFIASQMRAADVTKVELVLDVAGRAVPVRYLAAEELRGFLSLYRPHGLVVAAPPAPGTVLKVESVRVYRGSAVRLMTHGDVVLMMRERGIGRPSTYARTIEQLKSHGYVVESRYRKFLVPTRLGREVYNFLSSSYGELVSEERTRQLERKIRLVEQGEADAASLLIELLEELRGQLGDELMEAAARSLEEARSYA